MNNMPLVSIISPVYNCSDYISYMIESVINQTYVNWELILVDDNSEDNTHSIISTYSKKDKRKVKTQYLYTFCRVIYKPTKLKK